MKLAPEFPVIGPFLYRRFVRALAKSLSLGNVQAVGELCTIAGACSDPVAQKTALDALGSLLAQDAIDVFCNEVLERENPTLEKISINKGYVPSEPVLAALFLFITGQEEALCLFDPDPHHPLIFKGYAAAPVRIKARALRSAKGPRMCQILAHSLVGLEPAQAAGAWSYDEWAVVIDGLTDEKAWDLLWLLLVLAPPALAITALNAMKTSGWKPGGDGEQVFCELLRELPETWKSPAPEKPLMTMRNHDSPCMKFAFSRDGTLLATGTVEGRISVWQVKTARLITDVSTDAGAIRFLEFSPDNSFLVSGGNAGTISSFAIPSGDIVWSFTDKDDPVSCSVLIGSGEEIIAGTLHGKMIRLGSRTGKILFMVQGHPVRVTAVSTVADNKRVILGYADGTLSCCNIETGNEIWTAGGNDDPVRALARTQSGDNLFVFHDRSLTVLRNAGTGVSVRTYSRFSGHSTCHAISTEKQIAITGSDNNIFWLWKFENKDPAAEIPLYNRRPLCCSLTPDGTLAVVGCNDGTVFFHHVPDGSWVKEFRAYRQPVNACEISLDGKILALSGGDGTITLRDIPTGEILRTLANPSGAVTALTRASGTGDAGIIAGTNDGRARIFSAEDGTLVRSIDMYTQSVRALAVSPDGRYLACAGKDPTLRIWDLANDSLVATCDTPTTTVRGLVFLPGSPSFISGGWDGIVRIWDVPGGKLSEALPGHSSIITCCCAGPKGVFFVTGSDDTTVRIWSLAGETECIVLSDAQHEISACAVSPDGTLLAAAGTDPVIRLYTLPEGKACGTIPQVPGKPTALAFTGDGLAIAAGYDSGTLAYYSVHDKILIRTLPAHNGTITGIVVLPEKDCIATSGIDGRVHIHRVPFMRPLSQSTLADLAFARNGEQAAGPGAMAEQWRFLSLLLSVRFQNEIELCPAYRDAGAFDIQIVG